MDPRTNHEQHSSAALDNQSKKHPNMMAASRRRHRGRSGKMIGMEGSLWDGDIKAEDLSLDLPVQLGMERAGRSDKCACHGTASNLVCWNEICLAKGRIAWPECCRCH
ncbi:hypothetical protein MUK42_22984 [Musa troglodytarum]|uniref:Uncharacterized protein n=1 Tax=Musa troglodytarum TaxID=320322 RepID=A0A9E7G5Z3_9LILI|nr:hypothetical protein MUK42_22984 [Musa troglodytarum]